MSQNRENVTLCIHDVKLVNLLFMSTKKAQSHDGDWAFSGTLISLIFYKYKSANK